MHWKRSKKNKPNRIEIGGIVGSMKRGIVQNSTNSGNFIIDADYDDFIAGRGPNICIGGIAGKASNGTFKNVKNTGKIFIRDSKRFDSLEQKLAENINDPELLSLAIEQLQGIKISIAHPRISEKIERFLNIVNGVKDIVAPFVPYLMSLIP